MTLATRLIPAVMLVALVLLAVPTQAHVPLPPDAVTTLNGECQAIGAFDRAECMAGFYVVWTALAVIHQCEHVFGPEDCPMPG